MKKRSRNHQRKTKLGHSDGRDNMGPNEGRGQTHRRRGQREVRRNPRSAREVAVLYEDDAVIVLNKPAGLLAVPIKGSDVPSALSLLIAELKPR
jgi:23S rRNA-/tRNA-specific pseudouridylate synthase